MSDEKAAHVVCRGVTTRPQDVAVDMLFVPVFQDDDRIDDVPDLDETRGRGRSARSRGEFRGRPFESFLTPVVAGGWKAKRLRFVALACGARRMRSDCAGWRRRGAYTAQLRAVDSLAVLIRRGLDLVVAAGATADGLCVAELDCASYKRPDDRANPPPLQEARRSASWRRRPTPRRCDEAVRIGKPSTRAWVANEPQGSSSRRAGVRRAGGGRRDGGRTRRRRAR